MKCGGDFDTGLLRLVFFINYEVLDACLIMKTDNSYTLWTAF